MAIANGHTHIIYIFVGVTRTFQVRKHGGDDEVSVPLADGDLAMMTERFQ